MVKTFKRTQRQYVRTPNEITGPKDLNTPDTQYHADVVEREREK